MNINRVAALLSGVTLTAFIAPALAAGQPAQQQEAQDGIWESDIVVTAQRREERAQDVPIAITAFSQEQLSRQNITEPQALYGKVPSLVVGNQGLTVREVQSYSIRGQSSGFLASPAVAVYMAEVPLPAAISLNLQGAPGQFVDLENVQVLAGPQGTLFGRNTTGGAVLLVPRKPSNQFEGYVEGAVGNYDLRSLEGAINVPVIDDMLMVRATAAYYDRRGYTRDLVWDKWRDDQHWWTGRIGITLKPTERLENYLLGYYTKSSNNGGGNILQEFNYNLLQGFGFCADPPAAPVPGLGVPCDVYRQQQQISQENGPRKTRYDVDTFSKIKNWGIINTTSYELTDELTFRNIVSFQKLKVNYAGDQDGTPLQQYNATVQNARMPDFPIPGLAEFGLPATPGNVYLNGSQGGNLPTDYLKQWTEEAQIQGNMLDKHLTFTVGGFYYNAKPAGLWNYRQVLFCPAAFTGFCGASDQFSGVTNKSKALYAQGTIDLGYFNSGLENLRITGGYRYTWDTVIGFASSFRPATAPGSSICGSTGAVVPTATAAADCRFDATLKSKAPTWTIGMDYKPISELMLYGKISRGYKAGGFNSFAVHPETRTFQPEKLTSYEAGFKSDWRLGTVPFHLNANYYYSDYKNIQRPAGDFNATTGASGAQILAATATVQGFEIESLIRPIPALEIGGNLSYTRGRYKDFSQVVLAAQGQFACNGLVPQGGVADYSCNRFQFVAPWIYNIHANLDLPIPESLGELSLLFNYSHISSQNTTPLSPPEINGTPIEPGGILPGYGLLNASLTWANIGQTGVDATLFATNLTNKTYKVSYSGVFQSIGVWSHLYGEPRMVGLKLRYGFGR